MAGNLNEDYWYNLVYSFYKRVQNWPYLKPPTLREFFLTISGIWLCPLLTYIT